MSDSASKKEVEDVLSSVRRLVSGELPRNRRPSLPASAEALVLTDAHRIQRPTSKGHVARSLEDRIAELEAAVATRADEYEPDGSEDQAQHRPDRIVYTRPPNELEEAQMRGNAKRLSRLTLVEQEQVAATGDAPDQAAREPVAFRHDRRRTPAEAPADDRREEEAPMAEDVVAPPRGRAEVRRFHSPDDMVDRIEARLNGAELPAPTIGHNGFSERLDPYQAPEADFEAPGNESSETESVSESETVSEQSSNRLDSMDDISEEDEPDDFDAALDEAISDSLSSSGQAQATEAITGAVAGHADVVSAASAGDVDEDLLRPLVAKLIREELQGELGERITRNVRKLVRREILRALSAREFQ